MSNNHRIGLSIASVIFMLLSFFGGMLAGDAGGGEEGLRVTVLLYSGRPNPTYLLEGKEVMELKALLDQARINDKIEKESVIPTILGYSGIVVDNKGNVPGFPLRLAVYREGIEAMDEGASGKRKRFLLDESGTIENFLLDQAMKKNVIGGPIGSRSPTPPVPTTPVAPHTSCALQK